MSNYFTSKGQLNNTQLLSMFLKETTLNIANKNTKKESTNQDLHKCIFV